MNTNEFIPLAVRVTPRLRAKVEELTSNTCDKLNEQEKKDLISDLTADSSKDVEDFGLDGEGKPVQVLHYPSLKLVCKHSLFNIKDLIRDGQIVSKTPPPVDTPPSDELMSRRAYLQKRQQEKQYNQMVYNKETNPQQDAISRKNDSITSLTEHSSVAIQMIVAPIASFVIAYYVLKQSWKAETAVCMVWGLLAAMTMLLLEGVLFVVRAGRGDLVRKKNARQQHSEMKNHLGNPKVTAVDTVSKSAAAKKEE